MPKKKAVSVDVRQLRGIGRKAGTAKELKDLQILNVYEQSQT